MTGSAHLGFGLLAAAGVPFALAASYLLVLAVASLRRPSRRHGPVRSRVVVLVPAHDEALLVGRCVESLSAQDYPSELVRVVVIADNCTDATATVAATAGAQVLERHQADAPGKGAALRWAMDQVLAVPGRPDAVVIVDADSLTEPGMLRGLVRCFEDGAQAVQAEYLALNEDRSARSELRAAAFLLFHRVRFGGRQALGLPCHLVGNGMLLATELLDRNPWNAYTSAEDLEYSVDLRLAGVAPVFAGDARLRAPVVGRGSAARAQRLRWEGGRGHVIRTRLPLVLRRLVRGELALLDLAVDLCVPPLGLLSLAALAGAVTVGALAATSVVPPWVAVPWLVAVIAIPGFVIGGLVAGKAPSSMWRALALSPVVVVAELSTRVRLLRGFGAQTWVRTTREGEALIPPRAELLQVPIDRVDLDGAVARALEAAATGSFIQVCTVNLDFLVNARRDPVTREVLRTSALNLADGAPVVWLTRLIGSPVPGRVAGADLVPRLAEAACGAGLRVFFLGGERGTAAAAAQVLEQRYPSLAVAGVHQPVRAPIDDMDHADILRRIDEADADILLVALGHPKQDQWIARHRDQLSVSVAVGVGCTFDLLAGERRRAPLWMQRSGLEWLYRFAHEPRRLGTRYLLDAWCLLSILGPSALRQRRARAG